MNLSIKLLTVTFSILITLGLSGCYFDFDDDDFCERGTGSLVTDTRSMPAFSGISNSTDASIHIRKGEFFEVSVRSDQNIIDDILTTVEGEQLHIDTRKCLRDHNTSITITTPHLKSITNFGSSYIYSPNVWVAEKMDLTLAGSGEVEVSVDSEELVLLLTGSGGFELSGYTSYLRSAISGSGNVNAFALNANSCSLTISGSGNSYVHVDEILSGTISGSGNIYYRGFPTKIDVVVSGSGRVIDRN